MVFGALRLYYVLIMDFSNVTASQLPVVIMGTVEPGVAIMVSSSLLLKPVFDALFQRFFSCVGLSDINKGRSENSPNRAGTLLTFGGGLIGGRYSDVYKGYMNRRTIVHRQAEEDIDFGVELDGIRDDELEAAQAVTACVSFKSQETNDSKRYEDHSSDVEILVAAKTTVTNSQRY